MSESPPAVGSIHVREAIHESRLLGLWRLMRGHRARYLLAASALGLAALAKSGTYLLLRHFIDEYLVDSSGNLSLPTIAAGFILLALFEGGMTYVSGRLAAQTAESIAFGVRTFLYDHIQRLPFSYHDTEKTGDLISRSTSDVDSVRRFFADQAIGFGRISLLFLVNFTALAVLNLRLALMSIVVIPVVLMVSVFFFRRVAATYEQYQEQEAVLSTTLQENLTGVRVVKSFARQPYETDKFEQENSKKYDLGRRFFTLHALFWPVTDLLLGAQLLGGYYLAAVMAIDGTISIGTYLAYAGLLVWLIFPMRNLGRMIVQMSTGLVSYTRVMDIVREEREHIEAGESLAPGALRGDVEFEHVSFAYGEGDANAISDVSFRCKAGETIALLGSTGSGKTTLVNLLPRFYDFDSGYITLDGRDLKKLSPAYLRSQIGIVEQEPILFSRTIRENITYGLAKDPGDEAVFAAARAAAIHDVILEFTDGYDTLVGEKGVTLSGGQKQRVAVARTLLKDPKILILDDATSSVDTETEAEIRAALDQLRSGRTSFIIAHRIQSAMSADQVLVMDRGRIIQRGTHDELIEQDGLYRRIYELQTEIESELEKEMAGAAG